MADENSATVLQDGQLAIATVAQTGELITGPSKIDATALVQTEQGPQLCVKTVNVGEGGGGGGTTDYTDLENKPSINSVTLTGNKTGSELGLLENMCSAERSLILSPSQTNKIGSGTLFSVIIKPEESSSILYAQTVVGSNAGSGYQRATAIGSSAQASGLGATCVGSNTSCLGGSGQSQGGAATAIGSDTSANGGTCIGSGCTSSYGVAIGRGYNSSNRVSATGYKSIAIGVVDNTTDEAQVKATAQNSIQLGSGTNSTAKTLQVFEYQLLDGNTGKIPDARLDLTTITGYDATKTQTLKHVSGVLQWVDD